MRRKRKREEERGRDRKRAVVLCNIESFSTLAASLLSMSTLY